MEPISTDDEGDQDAISQLVAFGVDVTQTQNIEFHIAAPNSNSATLIQAALTTVGIHSSIYYDEGEPDSNGVIDVNESKFGPSWTVTALIPIIPSLSELLRVQSDINEIAQPFGGYSDGWGMMCDPKQPKWRTTITCTEVDDGASF